MIIALLKMTYTFLVILFMKQKICNLFYIILLVIWPVFVGNYRLSAVTGFTGLILGLSKIWYLEQQLLNSKTKIYYN